MGIAARKMKIARSPISRSMEKWIGVAIEIYPTTVFAFGENHEVVRISSKRPTAEQAKAAGGVAQEPEPPPTDLAEDEIREGGPPTDEEMRQIVEDERKAAGQ